MRTTPLHAARYRYDIPDHTFDLAQLEYAGGPDGTTSSRLFGSMNINGLLFHVDALQVELFTPEGEDYEEQRAVDVGFQEYYDELYTACGGDGPLGTLEYEGREYILIIYPFSA